MRINKFKNLCVFVVSALLVFSLALLPVTEAQNYKPINTTTITSYPAGVGAGQTGQIALKELAANGTNATILRAADSISDATIVVPSANNPNVGEAVKVTGVAGGVVTLGYGAVGLASINADTAAAQVISGSDDISVATSAGTTTIRRALESATGAYYICPNNSYQNSTGTQGVSAGNQVRLARIYYPYRKTIANIYLRVSTAAGSTTGGLGLYNADGSSLLCSGTFSSATTGVKTVTCSQALTPGFYLWSWTNTATTVNYESVNYQPNFADIVNTGTAQVGTAANSSSSGVLPATTGTITGAQITIPVAKFE